MRRRPAPGSRLIAWLSFAVLSLSLSPGFRAEAGPDPSVAPFAERTESVLSAFEARCASAGLSCSASVVELESSTWVHRAGDVARNPASNAKVLTAVAALSILGGDHRFTTGLFGDLRGDRVAELTLRGRGDPTFGADDLYAMVTELRAQGLRKVGSVVVDQSFFDGQYLPPAFGQQPNEWATFRAPVAAVSLDRNVVTFWLRAGEAKGDPVAVEVSPAGLVDLSGAVTTSAPKTAEKVGLSLSPKGDRLAAKVSGSLPAGRTLEVARRVDDPNALAGLALIDLLKTRGIEVESASPTVLTKPRAPGRALVTQSSAPLSEILPKLGKDSDNFTAEMVFLALGAKDAGARTDAAASAARVQKELAALHIPVDGLVVTNGSGLFDANRATTHTLAQATVVGSTDRRMAHEFLSQLAVGGVDGTLKSRFRKAAESRAIRAKTGTLAKSVALTGVILAPDGRPAVAYSFMADLEKGTAADARGAIDAAVTSLASPWEAPRPAEKSRAKAAP